MSSDIESSVAALGPVVQEYQAVVDDFDRESARILGVNETDLRCLELAVTAGERGISPREIADRLGLTTGSVTTMLVRLEQAGHLTRSPHPSDGRRVIVKITESAQTAIWEIIGPHIEESTAVVAGDFTADELASVRRFLSTVTAIQQRHVEALRGTPARGGGAVRTSTERRIEP
ncbi:MarR family transcriptional regulator [Arthrobacter sp. NPDC090010]|uniref:MarR family transcriptional regulator n=1 Tax=Arthrobacter sp. NPDC090010 TaxID=3363942 RepID=UPI00380BCBD4